MDNSLLVSLSQQLAAYRAMDVIANNIANASTPGFKREAAKFEEYVTQTRPAEGQKGSQSLSFVKDAGIRIDHALLSPPLAKRLKAAGVDRNPRGWEKTSDHAPVWVEVEI